MKRNCDNLHSSIMRLNANINKHKGQADVLKNARYVEEMNFVRILKEKEVETEDMQQKLQNLKREKENLMEELLDVE
ncbi:Coiled-coil domain-containing protein 40 [Cichlidogyrus casuarinus]|uniref:Coiled-coil domain-containing protein 40 n=1 Tax=Cichlidogyrus casuarinus TaxID=1844966 RepID=A0ABD2QEL3_9PLAT